MLVLYQFYLGVLVTGVGGCPLLLRWVSSVIGACVFRTPRTASGHFYPTGSISPHSALVNFTRLS